MLPNLRNINKRKEQVIEFSGIDCTDGAADGCLIDCVNMTLDDKPSLSTRKHRNVFKNLQGVSHYGYYQDSAGDHFYYIKDKKFYYDDKERGTLEKREYRITVMNGNIFICPDMRYYDTVNETWGKVLAEVNDTSASFEGSILTGTADYKNTFKVGEVVTIKGSNRNNGEWTIKSFPVNNKMEVTGTFKSESGLNITVRNKSPNLEYVVEHNNRLWGCGGNEIYASKQGSVTEFYSYEGLSSDSYAVEVGSTGNFTGITTYGGNVLFFKENYIHTLYGDKPKNFSIVTKEIPGVKYGCDKSIVIHKGMLFYQSFNNIVLFGGDTVRIIDKPLKASFNKSVGGTDGEKLYYCLYDGNIASLYVYDTTIREWIKEDNLKVLNFENWQGSLLMATTQNIFRVSPTSAENVSYLAILKPFEEWTDNNKAYSKLTLEVELKANTTMNVSIKHDDEAYKKIAAITGGKYHRIPFQPKRCHEFTLKIDGVGDCKIKRLVRTFRVGSDK